MTLLVARQCRLLRAPQGAVGALRRLQRPATITARSYADEAQAKASSAPASSFTIRKVDLRDYKQKPKAKKSKAQHPVTPKWENSDVVAVDSAILIPASVAATVSLLLYSSTCSSYTGHLLTIAEARTLHQEDRACRYVMH